MIAPIDLFALVAAALIVLVLVALAFQLSRLGGGRAPAGVAAAVDGGAAMPGRGADPTPLGSAGARGGAVAVAGPHDPFAWIINAIRRHRAVRSSLSMLSVGTALAAVGIMGYPVYTNLVQSRLQEQLRRQLVSPELRQAYIDGRVGVGDSLTRLRIPAIHVDVVVVEGTNDTALRAGAGHYEGTPLPCDPGNVAIAGHRTTYGRPFGNLDLLEPGDTISLDTPLGSCTYRLEAKPFVTLPSDIAVIADTGESMLTLTTCHPKGSARERLVVQATLVSDPGDTGASA